jgi:hypothetical protein
VRTETQLREIRGFAACERGAAAWRDPVGLNERTNVNFVTHFDRVECIIEDIGEDKMKTRSNSREKSCDDPDFGSFARAVKVDALSGVVRL